MFPRPRYVFLDDRGSSTVEYALIMIIAATLALILYTVVRDGSVEEDLNNLVEHALDLKA
jgi:Flp pilus assembly pilin Flp